MQYRCAIPICNKYMQYRHATKIGNTDMQDRYATQICNKVMKYRYAIHIYNTDADATANMAMQDGHMHILEVPRLAAPFFRLGSGSVGGAT